MIKLNLPKFNRFLALFVLFLPAALFAQETNQRQTTTNVRQLQPGQIIESKITGGETQEFGVILAENDFARVAYEKLFNQLEVGVYNPRGELIAHIGFSQLKSIAFAASAAGEYRVRVKSSLKQGDAAAYFITLAEKRPAKNGDENFIKAQTLYAEAAEITRQASLESRETGISKYKEAAEIWLAANETESAATAFNSLGVIQFQLSRFSDALRNYEQARRLFKPGSFQQAMALGNSGTMHLSFGNLQKALDAYNEALPAIRAEKEFAIEAIFLNNIGKTYERADSPRSIEFYEQALAVALKTNDPRVEATIRVNLGGRLVDVQQYERAAALFRQGIEIYERVKEPLAAASAYRALGSLYLKSKNPEKASENLEKALSLYRASGERIGEVNTLRLMGALNAERGDTDAALENLKQALSAARALEIRQSEALILYNTAQIHLKTNRLPEARQACEEALAIIEDLRLNLVNQSLREASSASLRQYYELYIHLLQKLGEESDSENYAARALEASERARARSLLQLLAETRADIREGVDAKLLERERELALLFKTKSEQQSRLLSRGASVEQKAAVAKEISALGDESETVRGQIRRQSPNYAALTQPQPLTAKEIQSLLDKDTILLEYALGDAGSFLWLVTPESVSSYKLPEREKIESAARRYYELITARNQRSANETALQKNARLKTADAEATQASRALGEILFGQIKEKIGGKRIVLVAEGALQYVPFASLAVRRPSKTTSQQTTNNEPRTTNHEPFLIESNEIISLPSASTLAVLRGATANRTPAKQTIAVFADPVFSPSDPRVAALQTKNRQPGKKPQNAESSKSATLEEPAQRAFEEAVESEAATIPRLPFSRREAEALLRLAPADETLKAVDFDANLNLATGKNLADYKIVHFATHGLLNSKNPELSGLVLSLVDEKGEPTNGFLRLNDIYNLRLNADLVVLSACQTALGRDIKGEGLIGLTRGFMYAGSARVVASLWKVDDAATAELMKRFYGNLLHKKLRAAEALRATQLEMSRDERFKSPYFWAAFTLQGEWK